MGPSPQVVLRLFAALAAVLLLAPPFEAQKRKSAKPEIEHWLGDLASARVASRERNTPMIVVIIQEGEEANDRFREGIYKNARFIKVAAPTVVVLVNDGKHPSRTVREERDGVTIEREVCAVLGTPKCADHKRNWLRVYQEFGDPEEPFRTPQVIAVLPNGKEHGNVVDVPPLSQVLALIEGARETAGPSLTPEQLLEIKGKLDTGRTMEKSRLWVQAYRAYARVLEITETSIFSDEARAGRERSLKHAQEELDLAWKWMEEGRVEDGYAKLLALKEELAGTPLDAPAKKKLKAAEKNKAWKEGIKAYKRKLAAEEIWQKCLKALDEGKQKSAERHAKTLLKKYADTPAGEKAKARFPELEVE